MYLREDATRVSKLKFELDGLPIFYKIDIVHFERVDSQLQNNIIKYGKNLI